jgi:hypothetical protein
MANLTQSTANKYWSYALWLALFTIFYNLAEGLISISLWHQRRDADPLRNGAAHPAKP